MELVDSGFGKRLYLRKEKEGREGGREGGRKEGRKEGRREIRIYVHTPRNDR